MDNDKEKPKAPWTARRVLALAGIILLIGLYVSTLVFALMDRPESQGLLMASIFCTIVVPVMLYAMGMVAKRLKDMNRQDDKEE